MKISLRIFRLSKKMVLILAGVLVLGGAAGATAVYIGKDKLLGPPAEVVNGGECTDVKIMKIRKKNRYWLRKYVEMEASDGLTRLKTALRVASVLYEKEQPDLVQVVVLDKNGPKTRAGMSGHAIGADVIYVPHPEAIADLADVPVLQATYIDNKPNASGGFYGQKIEVPPDEARQITASIEEKTDCIDPTIIEGVKTGEGAKGEGEGAAAEGEKAAEGGGHGATPKAEGEGAAAEGEAPKGEGEAAKGEGEASAEGEKPAAEGEAAKEDKGWFGSIKAMIFGEETASAEAPKAEGEKAAEGGGHGASPQAEGETAAPEGEPAAEAAPEGEGEAAPAEGEAATEAAAPAEPFAPGGLPDAKPAHGKKKPLLPAAEGESAAEPAPAAEGEAKPAAHSG